MFHVTTVKPVSVLNVQTLIPFHNKVNRCFLQECIVSLEILEKCLNNALHFN